MSEQEIVATEAEQSTISEQAPTPETVEENGTAPETTPEKTFTQKELDEIVQKRLDKERRKHERQRYKAEGRAEAIKEQQQVTKSEDKPKEADFTDYADFIEAIAEWKADQKIAERENESKRKAEEDKQKSEQERVNELKEELLERADAKYDDFDEVVNKSNFNISQAAYLAILESPISEDIIYHLANDPAAAEAFNELSPYAQAKEIGKLEDRLSVKSPAKTSNAPEPITPVGGAKATAETDPAKMTDKQFAEWRRKQIKARGR